MSASERRYYQEHNPNREARIEKGTLNERRVDVALQLLVEKQKISSWRQSEREEDQHGIDRFVELLDGLIKPLQVKSSQSGYMKATRHHPEIPCIVVQNDCDTEYLALRLLEVLA